jgi:hypothetical protein
MAHIPLTVNGKNLTIESSQADFQKGKVLERLTFNGNGGPFTPLERSPCSRSPPDTLERSGSVGRPAEALRVWRRQGRYAPRRLHDSTDRSDGRVPHR